jgi:predicted RNA binding protein YcfA (HicA-like mRNA interferase family)
MRRPLKPREIQKVALHLGFELKEIQSSHWQYKKDGVGKVTIPNYSEIGEDIFEWICRQLKITKKKFWEILDELE